MKKILLLGCLLMFPRFAQAVDIVVGQTHLVIPAPADFVPVTSDMKVYVDFANRFVPPTNEQFAQFLSSADAALATRGDLPVAKRKFYVQTAKEIIQPLVSTADFEQLKSMIKTQNAELLKKVETEMPGLFEKVNQGISNDFKVDVNLLMTQMLPLPPHDESERTLSYSMILKYNVNGADGKPVPFEGVVTATFVHVKGKVLFLYANAEKSGLEWSRVESKKWAAMVVAANPSAGNVAVEEARPQRSGIDWSEVARKGLIGGIIGGIIGLIGYFTKKKPAKSA